MFHHLLQEFLRNSECFILP